MKWLVVCLIAGCQGSAKDEPPAAKAAANTESAYKADIENLCEVITRSGAADHEYNDRTYLIATWLSAHLTTQDARKFLATIQPLAGEPKAKALEAEAARVGLAGCALAAEWRKASP